MLLFILLATALPIMSAKLYSNFTKDNSDEVTLYFHSSGEIIKMSESEYILGISLAQIDKKYSEDTLKAVARSFAILTPITATAKIICRLLQNRHL